MGMSGFDRLEDALLHIFVFCYCLCNEGSGSMISDM